MGFFGLAGLAGRVPNGKSYSFFTEHTFFLLNIMETCGQQAKVASKPKVLLGLFLKIQNLFWMYAELNRI